MNFSSPGKSIALIVCLLALIYFPLFLHLENLPIRIWDESRLAINAAEMADNGNFLVTHFEGKPDMWNTKPPMMIWLQVLFIKIFGLGELAIRLPSALGAFFTCLFIFYFCVKHMGNFQLGFIAPLVLITSSGYVDTHAARTGDYDALLTLFTTVSSLSFFLFVEKTGNRPDKFLYITFATLALGVLTKGIVALMLLPALLLYTVTRKQAVSTLRNKSFYLSFFVFLAVAIGYYLLREYYNPGYLQAVAKNELGGRYLKTIDGHRNDFWFYYHNLSEQRFSNWYLIVPFAAMIGLSLKNTLLRNLTLFSSIVVVSYFLIISSAQTRLAWYDLPMFPFLAIIVAVFINWLLASIGNAGWLHQQLRFNILPYLILVIFFFQPYSEIIAKIYFPKEDSSNAGYYDLSYYLKRAVQGKINVDGCSILHADLSFDTDYSPHVAFYMKILQQKNQLLNYKDWRTLTASDKVMAHQPKIKEYVESHYNFQTLDEWKSVKVYQINTPVGN